MGDAGSVDAVAGLEELWGAAAKRDVQGKGRDTSQYQSSHGAVVVQCIACFPLGQAAFIPC